MDAQIHIQQFVRLSLIANDPRIGCGPKYRGELIYRGFRHKSPKRKDSATRSGINPERIAVHTQTRTRTEAATLIRRVPHARRRLG